MPASDIKSVTSYEEGKECQASQARNTAAERYEQAVIRTHVSHAQPEQEGWGLITGEENATRERRNTAFEYQDTRALINVRRVPLSIWRPQGKALGIKPILNAYAPKPKHIEAKQTEPSLRNSIPCKKVGNLWLRCTWRHRRPPARRPG